MNITISLNDVTLTLSFDGVTQLACIDGRITNQNGGEMATLQDTQVLIAEPELLREVCSMTPQGVTTRIVNAHHGITSVEVFANGSLQANLVDGQYLSGDVFANANNTVSLNALEELIITFEANEGTHFPSPIEVESPFGFVCTDNFYPDDHNSYGD